MWAPQPRSPQTTPVPSKTRIKTFDDAELSPDNYSSTRRGAAKQKTSKSQMSSSREKFLMPRILSRPLLYVLAISLLFVAVRASGLRTRNAHPASDPVTQPPSSSASPAPGLADAPPPSDSTDALRFNTLGVAYMNQQKFADAQK
jgi:hypothetical protein